MTLFESAAFQRIGILVLAFAVTVGSFDCVTAPPVDLPAPPVRRPTIYHDTVFPSADAPLTSWPPDGTFIVHVEVDDPTLPVLWDVFVDYEPGDLPRILPAAVSEAPSLFDGGTAEVRFQLDALNDQLCHRIQFVVAFGFVDRSSHTPDNSGGDIVTWTYVPGGNLDGCPVYDGGPPPRGGSSDAALDALPVPSP